MLRLINYASSATLPSPQPPALPVSFFVDSRQLSENLYAFKARDFHHGLSCELTLEIQERFVVSDETHEEHLCPVVVGHFPDINLEQLNQKISWDPYLQASLTFQFHFKLLEQLLLFCEEKNATHIILAINERNWDYLEIYRRLFTSEEQILTADGEHTEIFISATPEIYDELVEYGDEMNSSFRKTLWHENSYNPIFRAYLKENANLVF